MRRRLRRIGALPRRLPLRWKLVLASISVLATVMVAFGVVLYRDLSVALVDAIASGLDTSAHTVIMQETREGVQRSSPPPNAGGPPPGAFRPPPQFTRATGTGVEFLPPRALERDPTLYERLALDLTNSDMSARVLDVAGRTLADGTAQVRLPTVASPLLDPSVYRQVAASRQARHVQAQTVSGAVLVELIPLVELGEGSERTDAIVQVGASLAVATSLLARLRVLLLALTAIAVVATALLTAALVGAVLEPLRRMTATTRAIASGDLSQRVAVPAGGDELTQLARSFNDMVGRLEALFAAQRRFLADASHELRTPLTALAGGLEMLHLPSADAGARARLIRLLEGETARMGRLVDGLLTLTRLDTRSKDALAVEPVDLVALAAQVVDETRLLAPDLDVELDAQGGDRVVVSGDADRLHQVLLNLCTNARAHTRPPGSITLAVRLEGATARVSVADTGSGIAPEELPRVWERFYRPDQARQRQAGQGGLGLGLAIVRAIVEGHGGTAGIASTPGAGTIVTVTLPLAPSQQAPKESAAGQPAAAR